MNSKRVCDACVAEIFLNEYIKNNKVVKKCSYCGLKRRTVTLEHISKLFKNALGNHFYQTNPEPTYEESRMAYEFGNEWYRNGEEIEDLFQEIGGIGPELASDIREYIEENLYDSSEDIYDAESAYNHSACYDEKVIDGTYFLEEWENLEKSLKERNRFFTSTSFLDHIFEKKFIKLVKDSVVMNLNVNDENSVLYRSRVFQTEDALRKALENPSLELGPPSREFSIEGRMNAKGISVFYGSFDKETAIAEVRPPIGSDVVVAKFKLKRKLNLLNLNALVNLQDRKSGSYFDTDFHDNLQRISFLKKLSRQLSRTIMPNDQPYEYIAAQAISDYLSSRNDLDLDGIIYPSSYNRPRGMNVALFYKSSRVRLANNSSDKIFAHTGHHTEDGYEVDYQVFVEKLNDKDEDYKENSIHGWFHGKSEGDDREITLEVDYKNLEVHFIKNITIATEENKVKWSISYNPKSSLDIDSI